MLGGSPPNSLSPSKIKRETKLNTWDEKEIRGKKVGERMLGFAMGPIYFQRIDAPCVAGARSAWLTHRARSWRTDGIRWRGESAPGDLLGPT